MRLHLNRATITHRLKTRRITQKTLAQRIHVTPQHLSDLLCGLKSPSLRVVVRLSDTLGLPLETLIVRQRACGETAVPPPGADPPLGNGAGQHRHPAVSSRA